MKKIITTAADKLIMAMILVSINYSYVFATDADAFWDSTVGFIFSWIARIGAMVGVFGIVQIGSSFASDNPDSRVRGIQFFVAGCIIFAAGKSPHFIGF